MTASTNFRIGSFLGGLAIKAPCKAISIANITLSGEQTVNNVAVVAKDRVLVTAQTDPIENGIYDVSATAWTRANDFDGNRDIVKGTIVTAIDDVSDDGALHILKVETDDPITIGETGIVFSQADGSGVDVRTANTTLTVGRRPKTLHYEATLTANRTVTLSTTNALNGDKFRVVRTGLGAYTIDVGGLKTIPSATAAFVDVEFDGTAWILTGYGEL